MDIKKFLKFFLLSPLIPILGVVESEGEESKPEVDPPEGQANNEEGESNPEAGAESGEAGNDKPEKDTTDHVPLKTYLDLKNKLHEEKLKNAELEDAKLSDEEKAMKSKIKEFFQKNDYNESSADDMVGFYELMKKEFGKDRKTNTESVLDEKIASLAQDSFYSDIEQYHGDIKSKIKQAKKAGFNLSVEEAYIMSIGATNARTKMKESRIKQEIIDSTQKTNQGNENQMPTASGGGKAGLYRLDEIDKKALEGLKKMQPDFGWDAKKYIESDKKD